MAVQEEAGRPDCPDLYIGIKLLKDKKVQDKPRTWQDVWNDARASGVGEAPGEAAPIGAVPRNSMRSSLICGLLCSFPLSGAGGVDPASRLRSL